MTEIDCMKKGVLFLFGFLFFTCFVNAQTVYEFSLNLKSPRGTVNCQVLFLDYKDGTGDARLRFLSRATGDSVLVAFPVKEEFNELGSGCSTGDLLFYQLNNPRFIDGTDSSVSMPAYFCFKMNPGSGLYEPFGTADSISACAADIIAFVGVSIKEPDDINRELVLSYFKSFEPFYRNLFVNNNTKALTITERNVKLFLLFVANVTDTEIGVADRKNMTEAIAFFKKIQEFLGISSFVYETITDQDFNKETVLKKIDDFLKPRPNDIVVFYYSGHGFRQPRDGRPGPYMDLRDLVIDKKKKYLENSLSTEDILVTIRRKGARLNLILSDCCNDNVTKTNPMAVDPALVPKKGGLGMNWSTQNCRDLFLNSTPMTILAAAASPYQLGISNAIFGGYFSTFFRNAVETHLGYSKSNVTWDGVFNQTKQQTERKASRTWCNVERTIKCNRQRPYVRIMYGRF